MLWIMDAAKVFTLKANAEVATRIPKEGSDESIAAVVKKTITMKWISTLRHATAPYAG